MKDNINSLEHWNARFMGDWDDKKGDEQSLFFAEQALTMFPKWLHALLANGGKTFCDWGCAEGDGTDLFAKTFPKVSFEGIDFSENAIETANKRFNQQQNMSFTAVDLLTTKYEHMFDIVFSSNVFEHFDDPFKTFERISRYAKEMVIIMVPYEEDPENMIPEHYHSFKLMDFAAMGRGWAIKHFEVKNTANLENTRWPGKQALVVFARNGDGQDDQGNNSILLAQALSSLEDKLSIVTNEIGELKRLSDQSVHSQTSLITSTRANSDKIDYVSKKVSNLKKMSIQKLDQLTQDLTNVKSQISSVHDRESIAAGVGDTLKKRAANWLRRLADKVLPRDSRRVRIISRLVIALRTPYGKLRAHIAAPRIYKEYATAISMSLFNAEFYLGANSDVRASGVDPLLHYSKYGWREGRNPSEGFSVDFYLASYPDVGKAGFDPLLHYVNFGLGEGRSAISLQVKSILSKARKKRIIVTQLDSFDKGGLEEVVMSLIENVNKSRIYHPVVFVVHGENGDMAGKAMERGIEVVYLHGNRELLAYYVRALGVSLVHLHYSTFGVDLYKVNAVKTLYTVHNNYIWANDDFVKQRQVEYEYIDHFIAVSSQVKNYFERKFRINEERLAVIPNGVCIERLSKISKVKRGEYEILDNDFVFVSVASFTPNKFHPLMLVALSRIIQKHPQTKLLLVGNVLDQDYYRHVLNLISRLNLANYVRIVDYVPKEKVMGLLRASNAFLQPSLTEGFSIATIEAMYSKLPLLLSDVGGARDVIADNDIGIIIREPYWDIYDLTEEDIKENYSSDRNLVNLDDLVVAMDDFITNRLVWAKKAEDGYKKVQEHYTDTAMAAQYMLTYQSLLLTPEETVIKRLEEIKDQLEVAVVAPFPAKSRVNEGWMSRISAIDRIISVGKNRIYIHLSTVVYPTLERQEDGGWELVINQESDDFRKIVSCVIDAVNMVYVHTLHLAEYMMPWLDTGKVVVDFHGITPEEEVMMGRPELRKRYERVEKRVLQAANTCIMVTNAMRQHYSKKYPQIEPRNVIILPIVEKMGISGSNRSTFLEKESAKVVYSGGSQAWQNVDAMINMASRSKDYADFTFLSHD